MNFDLNSFSIQGFMQKIQDFGFLKIGIIIGVLALYLILLGIAGKKLKIILLILAAVIAGLFTYSGTRSYLLEIPGRVSAMIQPNKTGAEKVKTPESPSPSSSSSSDDGEWVTVSASGEDRKSVV